MGNGTVDGDRAGDGDPLGAIADAMAPRSAGLTGLTGGWGYFGKISGYGDFVRKDLAPSFIEVWEPWLHAGLQASREALGHRWQEAYLTAPIWRFALPPGLAGPEGMIGVLMPSVDRVGRFFPLTLAAPSGICLLDPGPDPAAPPAAPTVPEAEADHPDPLAAPEPVAETAPSCAAWGLLAGGENDAVLAAAETAALDTLNDGAERTALEGAVAGLPAPVLPPSQRPAPLLAGGAAEQSGLCVLAGTGTAAAARLADAMTPPDTSLWMADTGAGGCTLLSPGLPVAEAFVLLLTHGEGGSDAETAGAPGEWRDAGEEARP
ncbi:MAG: type VI secretion system-associated protein TagF [Pseudomonadota bacterium]